LLTNAGIPASPINTVADVVKDANIDYRGMITEVEQPEIGKVRIANTPLRFSLAPKEAKIKPAPCWGNIQQKYCLNCLVTLRKKSNT